ncbi:unnamed protein product [Mytilus coruscus]|uniref:Mab-21-like nucleotidyltransferase domain-containing protein n=1 Tax=Mytilus coruscus TaxID=42192 RepID=A0A6J8DXS7_MYTCO|nr:unnamed protein product [Mytilus coruscus]
MTTDLSISFYHYLCQKLGTEDMVKIRRLSFAICDYVSLFNRRLVVPFFGRPINSISSGSKAEGLDMKSSDIDIMLVIEMVNVVEDPLDRFGFFSFLISQEYTKPGFVRLKLHHSVIQMENNWCKERDGFVFLSSEQFKMIPFSGIKKMSNVILHGPCITTATESHDLAFCLRSKSWIAQAQEWVFRNRSWPSYFFTTDFKSWTIFTGFDYELFKSPLRILKDSSFSSALPNTLVDLFSMFSRHKLVSHRYLYTLYWCAICEHIGHKCIGIHERSNKDQYKRYKTYLPYLVMGLQKDAHTGWLCFASYFFSMDSYKTCLNLIEYILHKYGFEESSYIESHIFHINSLVLEAVKYGVMNAHNICRRHNVDLVGFCVTTEAWQLNLKLEILDNICILTTQLVYTFFLRFMCYFHLGDNRGIRCALHDLHRLRISYSEFAVDYCLGVAYYALKEYSTALSFLVPFSEVLKSKMSNYRCKIPSLTDLINKLDRIVSEEFPFKHDSKRYCRNTRENQVAVTLQESKFSSKPEFVAILDSEQLKLISQNEIKCTPFGIVWYENVLAVGSWNTIQFYDLDFSFVRSIELPDDKIAVKFIKRGPDGTLSYSTSTANCISSNGINIFRFSVENGIPRGISDKIHFIGTLLTGDQGLGRIGSLRFNKDYTKLYVASDHGSSQSDLDFLED